MSKHTPGPWNPDCMGMYIFTSGDAYGHGNMMVAQVRGCGHLTGVAACNLPEADAIAIQKANCRLIAAAPALLEACRAAYPELEALLLHAEQSGLLEDWNTAKTSAIIDQLSVTLLDIDHPVPDPSSYETPSEVGK